MEIVRALVLGHDGKHFLQSSDLVFDVLRPRAQARIPGGGRGGS